MKKLFEQVPGGRRGWEPCLSLGSCFRSKIKEDRGMETLRNGLTREEIVRVADHETGFVGGQLRMEEDLRNLGHAYLILETRA